MGQIFQQITVGNSAAGCPDQMNEYEAYFHSVQQSGAKRYENLLASQITAAGLPPPEREFRFHSERKWRFDFAWPAKKWAVEVEGGIWANGRHNRGGGFEADCIKYNEAAVAGWRVLRVTPKLVADLRAIQFIKRGLADG